MKQYLDDIRDILQNGFDKANDRTGTGRRSVICRVSKYDVSDGTLPLVTTRKLYPDSVIRELLWFIKGSSCTEELRKLGVKFWDRWAVTEADIEAFIDKYMEIDDESMRPLIETISETHLHELGPIYGPNWRNAPISNERHIHLAASIDDIPSDKLKMYEEEYREQNTIGDLFDGNETELNAYCIQRYTQTIDQLNELVLNLKRRPYSSRHVVSAWVPEFIPCEDLSPQENVILGRGALAPCHVLFQCHVKPPMVEGGKQALNLVMYQRSNDVCVGNPYNIAQYALLLHMLAHVTDMEPDAFYHIKSDAHLYFNQIELAKEQIKREPLPLPGVWLNPEVKDLFAFTPDDIRIEGYLSHDPINYPVSV